MHLFQDDDYVLRPEIIFTMHSKMSSITNGAGPIYLSPPDEYISTSLRTVYGPKFSTSFTWLGYGTYMERRTAVDFLRMASLLQLSPNMSLMLDNYFSILKNDVPEIWHGHTLELRGGQAFTRGDEGRLRNLMHMAS